MRAEKRNGREGRPRVEEKETDRCSLFIRSFHPTSTPRGACPAPGTHDRTHLRVRTIHLCHSATHAPAAAKMAPAPLVLTFPDRAAPLGPLLIAAVAGIDLDAAVDPAAGKGAEPVLKLGSG